jgi:hypothetical protein
MGSFVRLQKREHEKDFKMPPSALLLSEAKQALKVPTNP